jgi:glycosyltransferase involved in cell wall biosynthesis
MPTDLKPGVAAGRVIAVVVTHNRRALLARCLEALRSQKGGLERILVVDNASTDGTQVLLHTAAARPEIPLDVLRPDRNLGGAGGFAVGMDAAVVAGADWLWLMDDDSEPEPEALLELHDAAARVSAEGRARPGFLASRVLWRDGSNHRMNRPGVMSWRVAAPAVEGLRAVDYASFVSLLVSRDAVVRCGLPIAEFFLGSDDVEYTWRLTRAGFAGYEVAASRVRHLTERNVGTTLWGLEVAPDNVETWAIKTRNLVAVNRRRPWGWVREALRVMLLDVTWRYRRMPPRLRRRLVRAARQGLTWAYEPLIRDVGDSGHRTDAYPGYPA